MLERFDGIEIHRFIIEGDDYFNTTDIKDFHVENYFDSTIIYSVQGHLHIGGVDDIAEFQDETLALEIAECINLKMKYEHGINIHY